MTIAAAGLGFRFEDQNDLQPPFEDQNDPQTRRSEDHFDPPTSDPDLYLEERTDTPRAREDSHSSPDLPLVGVVPPVKCAHPHAHAWCDGRVHVPRPLHFEFLDRLDTRPGETRDAKAGRLVKFYADTMAAIPATQAIAEDAYKFWRTAFAAACAAPSPKPETTERAPKLHWRELDEAKRIRSQVYGTCPHDPRCESYTACVRAIALARRSA